jgi:hypothetical protein
VALLGNDQTFTGRDSFSQGVSVGTGSKLEGFMNINTNVYLFSKALYLRGETVADHNHGLAYSGGTVTNFGTGNVQVDGPVLWGFGGGALGSSSGGAHAVLTWAPQGVTIAAAQTGGIASPVAVAQNTSTAANASPAMRVITAGNAIDGALAVSANGTGLIARFGNYFNWVADIATNGDTTLAGALVVDNVNANSGSFNPGLSFGSFSGETIASKRTSGGNQYGLDFYTSTISRLSISNNGTISANGLLKASAGLVIENRTSDPPSPVTGQIWLRTDLP